MVTKHFFDNSELLFQQLTTDCLKILQHSLTAHQKISLLLSGGSTPIPLYQHLAKHSLDWHRVQVALVDERWVKPAQEQSNQRLITQHLLQNKAQAAQFIPMKNDASTAMLGVEECEQHYQQLAQPWVLSILGMGEDGHFASLFPQAQGVDIGLNPKNQQYCTAINAIPSPITGEVTERISLTGYALSQVQHLVLLIKGQKKLDIFNQAMEQNTTLPLGLWLHNFQPTLQVYWAP